MQRRTFLRLTLATGVSLALAGCGFRLRGTGSAALPFTSLAVDGTGDDVSRLAIERLQAAGVSVDEAAPQVLNLGPEAFGEQRLSVLDSGRQEYDMSLSVPFSIQRRDDGAYRLAQQHVEVQERFTLSSNNLLSEDDRREAVRRRLRQKAVDQLLDRLRALDGQ
ncbi:LPS-assembly lipoprotein LptE [Halomonas caseinilytica]|uniref:LPS-assembly lipoprotein LptE n=1 Tax=Halomonas caseinilytica TaxID=438744 RepID=A0A1M6U8I9_9GAMM|nr:LPS assembly lipoprotein LptE [Halomonas caseinilytica]SEM94855.1 LPS-assembly lipoprotein [Halomonas caseinilytica]SHK65499.1 LPS-assembly lipoprotein [Halomonas caseinilytica]